MLVIILLSPWRLETRLAKKIAFPSQPHFMPYHGSYDLLGSCDYSPCSEQCGFAGEAVCASETRLLQPEKIQVCWMQHEANNLFDNFEISLDVFLQKDPGTLLSGDAHHHLWYLLVLLYGCWVPHSCAVWFFKSTMGKTPVWILVVLQWNVADEIMLYGCSGCSWGNLEQWSLRAQRQLEWYGKGQCKVPGDWSAPWSGTRGQEGHDKKLKQWDTERRQGVGAEPPSVFPWGPC